MWTKTKEVTNKNVPGSNLLFGWFSITCTSRSSYLSEPLTCATSSSVSALLTPSSGLESGRYVDRSVFVPLRGENGRKCQQASYSLFCPSSIDFCFSQMVPVRTNKQTNKPTSLNSLSLCPSFLFFIQGSSLPLSIIIVGVGPAEFDGECFASVSRLLTASTSRCVNTIEMRGEEKAGRREYLC